MEVIYNNILDDLQDKIEAAENQNRTIKEIVFTIREYGDLKKQNPHAAIGIDGELWDTKVLGIPYTVEGQGQ